MPPHPSRLEIRAATADDTHAWLDLRYKLWPHASIEDHAEEIRQDRRNSERRCVMAFSGDKAVGFVELSLRSVVDGCSSTPVVYLEGFYVEPNHQAQGIGRKLLEAGQRWGRDQGCTEMGSDAELENQKSIDVHLKLGFEEVDRVVQFRKNIAQN